MVTVWVMLIFLAIGLNMEGAVALSSTAILFFVGAFAIGLGPVPFVLIGELVPFYAASATASLALSVNWASGFLVGVGFLPLREAFGIGREGNVFAVFALVFAVIGLAFVRLWK